MVIDWLNESVKFSPVFRNFGSPAKIDPGASVLCIIFEATTKQGSAQECSVNITSTSVFTLGKIHLILVANFLNLKLNVLVDV